MTTPGLGYLPTDCSTIQLHSAMIDPRVVQVIKDLEDVAHQYMESHPGLVAEHKLTGDHHIFVKVVSTFKFPL